MARSKEKGVFGHRSLVFHRLSAETDDPIHESRLARNSNLANNTRQNQFRNWTEHDDQRLIELKAAGRSAAVIAKHLKRTEAAIVGRTGILKHSRV